MEVYELFRAYLDGSTLAELGEREGVSTEAIRQRFVSANLPRRSLREANLLAAERGRHPRKPPKLCRECRGVMGRATKTDLCKRCRDEDGRARRADIAALWARGLLIRDIAARVGSTEGALQATLHKMRVEGWDLPPRNKACRL